MKLYVVQLAEIWTLVLVFPAWVELIFVSLVSQVSQLANFWLVPSFLSSNSSSWSTFSQSQFQTAYYSGNIFDFPAGF